MMQFGLSDKTLSTVRQLLSHYPAVEKAIIYGSRAKGNYKSGSDIDLTLTGDSLDYRILSDIADALDESPIPYTVDLSLFDHIDNQNLRAHIERVGKVLYQREISTHSGVAMKAGWQTKRLGEFIKLQYGKPLPDEKRKADGKYPVYGANGEKDRTDEFYFDKPTIIVGRKGSAGEINLTEERFWPLDVTYFVEFDEKELSLKFLYNLLDILDLPKLAKGVKPGINRNEVYSIGVKVPPLPEQQRIVAILDEAFEGIATATANAKKNLNNARELFDSTVQAVFTQHDEGWIEKPLSELCGIKHGFAFKSEFFRSEGDYVLLTPGNFYESGGYRDRGEKQKYYGGEIPEGFILEQGDMLVAMTEQAEGLLGSPILIPESGKFLHNQRLGLVTQKSDVPWINEFFFYVFNTKAVRKKIHGSAAGVKVRHTSPTKIGEVLVRFPTSISEQRSIVATLNGVREETQRLETIYQQKLVALDELKKSLLQKAFCDEL